MNYCLIQQVFNAWKTVTQMELLVQDGIVEAYGMFTVTVPTTAQPAYSIDQFAISENGIIEAHEMFTVPPSTTAQPAYPIDEFAISENGIVAIRDEAMGGSDV